MEHFLDALFLASRREKKRETLELIKAFSGFFSRIKKHDLTRIMNPVSLLTYSRNNKIVKRVAQLKQQPPHSMV